MIITTPEIEQYITNLLPPRHEVFLELEAYAQEQSFPIIGPMVGNVLSMLAASVGSRRVMELGSGFGYSALWFASALPEDARIFCTDGNEAHRDRALQAFERVGVSERIEFHCGDALGIFSEMEGDFDFIFCDIDKHEYPAAFRAAFPRVRQGGYLAFDNALWSGRMLEGDTREATAGVVALNRLAFSEPGCHAAILPIRDGVLLCRKLR
ncbi:MAG: O-methyltransferase [Bacteroidia bacterium]|nr:O-methyltransferase [Bacteroidia bacterium]